jgi:phosphate:Na+ symporter
MAANLIEVLGGLAIFLLGIDMLSMGMEKLAGKRIQTWLDRMTDRPFKAAVFGTAATAILQSSSLLMVTMIGLINANLFTLQQAVGVMMGQEIGTTLTGQLIAFDVGSYLFALLILGYVLYGFGAERQQRAVGQTLLGIGVVFLGLESMKSGIGPLTQQASVELWLASMGQRPLLGVLAGAVVTALIQSSSAMTGLTIALGISHAITLQGAIFLIFGANIGTCVTGWLASLHSSVSARRASMAQILINLLGVAFFFPFATPFARLMATTSSSLGRQIANAHSTFNIAVSVALFPFIPVVVRLCKVLIPGEDRRPVTSVQFLDENLLKMPPIALQQAAREVVHVGDQVGEMLFWSREALLDTDSAAIRRVLNREREEIDPQCRAAEEFVDRLLRKDLTEPERQRCLQLKHWITDIERVADMTENMAQAGQERSREAIPFSQEAQTELTRFHELVTETWTLAVRAAESGDKVVAEAVKEGEEQIDVMERQLRESHNQRMERGICTPKANTLFIETLRNLERIGDHADNLSVSVLRS